MKRIIISTSFERLHILGDLQFEKNLFLLQSNPVIGFTLNNEFSNNHHSCYIVLIKEELPYTALQDNGLIIVKETDFFLHHTNVNGLLHVQENLFHKSHIQKGAHEKNTNDIYFPLFTEIIFNDSIEEKVSVIIKRFFNSKIDAADSRVKTDFLSYIYNGNMPVKYQIPQSVMNVEGVGELIQYFKQNPYQKKDTGSNLCSEGNIKYVQLMGALGFKHK